MVACLGDAGGKFERGEVEVSVWSESRCGEGVREAAAAALLCAPPFIQLQSQQQQRRVGAQPCVYSTENVIICASTMDELSEVQLEY